MKRFGSFKPLDAVVSESILSNLHVAVSSVSELTNSYPDNTIAVFTSADGEYKQGDVAVKKNGTWVRLSDHLTAVGPVTELRGFRLDKKVYLKYRSPADTYSNTGVKKASWMKEIIVRKYGSSPVSEYDGTVVRVVLRKNVFTTNASQYLIDYIPDADNESDWYYRVFVVADNGKIDYEHTAPAVKVYDMPWSNLIEAVRDGHAKDILAVGDAFRLDDGNEIVVANITERSPYRITMLLKYPVNKLPFDTAKPSQHRVTRDTRIQARKTYYRQLANGGWEIASMYAGVPITSKLYELVSAGISTKGDAGRVANGCNRWSISDIRYWMNIMSYSGITAADKEYMQNILVNGTLEESYFNDPSTIPDDVPIPPYLYLKKYQPDLLNCIATTTCRTAVPLVDGINFEETTDRFFIPSITEITGLKNTGKIAEGTQFQLFENDPSLRMMKMLNPDGTLTGGVECFTRSPDLSTSDLGYGVLPVYDIGEGALTAAEPKCIPVMFNIG